jgi:hypothetical protein
MGREICCVDNLYFEYSTVVDNVVSPVLPKKQFEDWYLERYTSQANAGRVYKELQIRLGRVEKNGTSNLLCNNLADAVRDNTSGPDGTALPFNEFCQHVIGLAEELPEPEVKYLIPAKLFRSRLDPQIAYWVQHYRRNHDVPIEQSKAEHHLIALQSVRETLLGEKLDEASVPNE